MFSAPGRLACRRRHAIVVGYLLLVPLLVWCAATVFPRLRGGSFEVPDCESYAAFKILERDMKVGGADVLALWTIPEGTIDDISPYRAAFEALARIEQDPAVVGHVP